MRDLHTLEVNNELRAAVERLIARLGDIHTVSASRWSVVAEQCFGDVATNPTRKPDSTVVLVGPLAFVLKHAAVATDNFGVVMPVAQTSRPWQRAANWRDDATLELWRHGWSPRALDRVLVPSEHSVIEFAVGDVRQTPQGMNGS